MFAARFQRQNGVKKILPTSKIFEEQKTALSKFGINKTKAQTFLKVLKRLERSMSYYKHHFSKQTLTGCLTLQHKISNFLSQRFWKHTLKHPASIKSNGIITPIKRGEHKQSNVLLFKRFQQTSLISIHRPQSRCYFVDQSSLLICWKCRCKFVVHRSEHVHAAKHDRSWTV